MSLLAMQILVQLIAELAGPQEQSGNR
jgi:hypothetical protein